jgi:hypothetical protein
MQQDSASKCPSLATIFSGAAAVMAAMALFVSLSGAAEAGPAHAKVGRKDLLPGAVTAKALARGAVGARALAKGAVQSTALAKGSVTASAIASGAVTSASIAPGSVGAVALKPTKIVFSPPVKDEDAVESNPEWTASSGEDARCESRGRVFGGGYNFTNPGNRQDSVIGFAPFTGPADGVTGRITTNSGGHAEAVFYAICLEP